MHCSGPIRCPTHADPLLRLRLAQLHNVLSTYLLHRKEDLVFRLHLAFRDSGHCMDSLLLLSVRVLLLNETMEGMEHCTRHHYLLPKCNK